MTAELCPVVLVYRSVKLAAITTGTGRRESKEAEDKAFR